MSSQACKHLSTQCFVLPKCVVVYVIFKKMFNVSTWHLASLTMKEMYRNKIKKYFTCIRCFFSCHCLIFVMLPLSVKIFLQSITVCLYIVTTMLMNKIVRIFLVCFCFFLLWVLSGLESTDILEETHQRATTVQVSLGLPSSFCSRHLPR